MDNTEKISLQKIFNLAWEHFIVRDEPPAVHEGSCTYLTPDGRKCAVGLALPDGHPSQGAGVPLGDLVDRYPPLFSNGVRRTQRSKLNRFQFLLHDSLVSRGGIIEKSWVYSLDERKEEYLRVAHEYGLTVPEDSAAR